MSTQSTEATTQSTEATTQSIYLLQWVWLELPDWWLLGYGVSGWCAVLK